MLASRNVFCLAGSFFFWGGGCFPRREMRYPHALGFVAKLHKAGEIQGQTRQHSRLINLLGVKQIMVGAACGRQYIFFPLKINAEILVAFLNWRCYVHSISTFSSPSPSP